MRVPEGACWNCRKKRLKCDLRRPKCSKCELRSAVCDYSQRHLQWVGGAAVRGRLTYIGHGPHNEESPTGHITTTRLPIHDFSPQLAPSPMSPSPLVPEALVMYFRNAVWPRFQLSDQLISLDENLLMYEPALREAVLAVSQAHHHQLLGSESSCTISPGSQSREQSRQLALSRFRRRLEDGVGSEDDARRLFQIVCIFCILDGVVFPNEQGNASIHLRGGCSMLSTWETIPLKMLLAGGLQAHLFSVFATVDLVHSLLSGDKPHFQPSTWLMFADVQAWWGRLSCEDPLLTILKLYSEIAFLGHIVHNHLPESDGSVLAKRCLPPIMRSLGASTESRTRSCAPEFTTAGEWDAFCSIYEASAIIYVYRALEARCVDDEDVQRIVHGAISTLVDRPPTGMMAHCLIFPLLVVGSHCLYARDRRAVSDVLSSSMSYLAFGNLVLMTNLLKDIWSQDNTNSSWWEMFRSVSKTVFLF